jgi:GNAT superfamily N-acetyltransferase
LPAKATERHRGGMHIDVIDPADDGDFGRWFDAFNASYVFDWPGEPGWQYAECRAKALGVGGANAVIDLIAADGDAVLGTAQLAMPLHDNLHRADLQLAVLPEHRGRGVGSALLVECERRLEESGRPVMIAYYESPAWRPGPAPGDAFSARHGYTVAQVELRRELRLPYDDARLHALEEQCRPYADGYRFLRWRNACPEGLLEGRAEMGRRMSVDAPRGRLEIEEQVWDADRVRGNEKLAAEQDNTMLAVGALHEASGQLVGFTELGVPNGEPAKAYQWDTLVHGEHRGHRLGTLLKIENLRALADYSPATTSVATWNAAENAAMIAINDALGCVVVGSETVVQKHLSGVVR